jgi:hypothetical protein
LGDGGDIEGGEKENKFMSRDFLIPEKTSFFL